MASHEDQASRRLVIEENAAIPRAGFLLAYGAMAPLMAAAVAAWIDPVAETVVALTILWGAALLLFFSGVRRGLSFRTEGGARPAQLVMMSWLFAAGLAALIVPGKAPALLILLGGFASLGLFDPPAARRGEAPVYFAPLRRRQMLVPVVALAVVLVSVLV